jgi:hypothetical protein
MPLARRTLIAAALWPFAPVRAQTINEARVKAKLSLTLARYTQWPAKSFSAATDALALCALQRSDTVASAFAELEGQTVDGHPIRVLSELPAAGPALHVLYLQDAVERASPSLIASLAPAPVLTISDSDGFAARGGMVELVNVNDSIRLEINLRAMRTAQLELSSRVLQLARKVRD